MSNLRRYYYHNKIKIWKAILIIVSILILIQFANYMVKIKNNENEKSTNNIQTSTVTDETSLVTDKSTISGETIDEKKLEKQVNLIEKFLDLCNNKEFEKAYELLSQECKQNVFNSYDIFKKVYCDKIFTSKKTYTMENWAESTYKVRIAEDILATGQTSTNGTAIQDFITIVTNEGQNKLNINNYIGKTDIQASNTKDDITIKVLEKNTYKDYEIYNIEVINNSKNTIYLDDGEETSTLYVQDSNGVKYEATTNELIYSTLKVKQRQTIKYSIKFNNIYNSKRQIKSLVFDKLILNYDKYIKNKEDYENIVSFKITL